VPRRWGGWSTFRGDDGRLPPEKFGSTSQLGRALAGPLMGAEYPDESGPSPPSGADRQGLPPQEGSRVPCHCSPEHCRALQSGARTANAHSDTTARLPLAEHRPADTSPPPCPEIGRVRGRTPHTPILRATLRIGHGCVIRRTRPHAHVLSYTHRPQFSLTRVRKGSAARKSPGVAGFIWEILKMGG
jgi:hypothetical protein